MIHIHVFKIVFQVIYHRFYDMLQKVYRVPKHIKRQS